MSFADRMDWEMTQAERRNLRHFTTSAIVSSMITGPVVMGGRALYGMTSDYERRMRLISSLTEVKPRELPMVGRNIGTVARQTGLDPAELADAFYYIASTGNNAQSSSKIMRTAARMSVAGMGRPNVLADTLTTALQVYGEPANRAPRYGNVLAEAVALGKGEANLYAPAAGKVMASARLAGISFEEVMANIATASRAGIKPNQSGTALNMLLENLRDPSNESAKTMKAIGTSPKEVVGMLRNPQQGLMGTLNFLFEKSGHNEAIMSKMIGSVTGLRNALSTAGAQTEAYAEILGKLQGQTNRVDHAFEQMSKTADRFASNPIVIAKAIARAVSARRPAARYVAPWSTNFVLFMQSVLPTRMWDWAMARDTGRIR